MAHDIWGRLWDLATSEDGDPATIILDPEDADHVTLCWSDGSKRALEWVAGDWCSVESIDPAPGDVAARDSL